MVSRKRKPRAPEWSLVDGCGYELEPRSEQELVRALKKIDALAKKRAEPLVATLYAPIAAEEPPWLSIGLGADESVLVHADGDFSGEGGYSKGTRIGDETEVAFRYGTTFTEYQAWMLIPKQAAIAACCEFYRTGVRPTCVAWQEL
jgi:hypothetical protein